jgi:hypothetical protein
MGLFSIFKKKKEVSSVTDEDRKYFADQMVAHAAALVDQFKERFNLDFSVESLAVLDKILEDTAKHYKNQMDKETQRRTIEKAGAYIFEVAKLNFGGTYFWYDALKQPILVTGQPEFDMSLLAYEKVKGRLENGYEDNIPFFFQGYIEGVERKLSAMIV